MRTSRVPNSPPSGIIHPPTHLSTSQIAHSLEESARCQDSHSPNSSSGWNNQYAHRPSTVRKPPPTGEKHPRTGLQTSQNLQALEELIRWYTSQHPDSPTHWRNLPAHTPPNCPDSSSEWRDPDTSSRTVSTAAIVWTRRHAGWRAWRTPSPLQGTQTPSARPIGWQSRIRRP